MAVREEGLPVSANGGQRRSLPEVPSYEFSSEMLGVGRAAAVSKEQCFVASEVSGDEGIRRCSHRGQAFANEEGVRLEAPIEIGAKYILCHARLIV